MRTTGDLLDFLCDCLIVVLGDIKKGFRTTFLDQVFLATMVNSDDPQSCLRISKVSYVISYKSGSVPIPLEPI